MGKMITALMLVFAIEFSLFIFQFNVSGSSLFDFLTNPTSSGLEEFSLYNLFVDSLETLTVLGAVIATSLFIIRPETIPALIALSVITFIFSIIHLWTVIASQSVFGDASNIVATIIAAPLLIYYLVTVIDFWRKPD